MSGPLPRWLPLPTAATALGLTAAALRRTLERNAKVGVDGTVEANIDGVRARKFGRLWRVHLGPGWSV